MTDKLKQTMTAERQIRLLVLAGCSVAQISEIVSLSNETVRKRVRKLGLFVRAPSESLYDYFLEQDRAKAPGAAKISHEVASAYAKLPEHYQAKLPLEEFHALYKSDRTYGAVAQLAHDFQLPLSFLQQVLLRLGQK